MMIRMTTMIAMMFVSVELKNPIPTNDGNDNDNDCDDACLFWAEES